MISISNKFKRLFLFIGAKIEILLELL